MLWQCIQDHKTYEIDKNLIYQIELPAKTDPQDKLGLERKGGRPLTT